MSNRRELPKDEVVNVKLKKGEMVFALAHKFVLNGKTLEVYLLCQQVTQLTWPLNCKS